MMRERERETVREFNRQARGSLRKKCPTRRIASHREDASTRRGRRRRSRHDAKVSERRGERSEKEEL